MDLICPTLLSKSVVYTQIIEYTIHTIRDEDVTTLKKAIEVVCKPCTTRECSTEVRRDFLLNDALKEANKAKFDGNSSLKVINKYSLSV